MEELKRINAGIDKKQIGRMAFRIGSLIFGVVLIGKHMYQYEVLTAKVLEELDKMCKC